MSKRRQRPGTGASGWQARPARAPGSQHFSRSRTSSPHPCYPFHWPEVWRRVEKILSCPQQESGAYVVWYRNSSSADAQRHLGPLPLPRVHCKGPGLRAPCHRHVHTSTVTTLSVLLLPAVLGPLHVLPTHAQIAARRPRPTGKPSAAHGLVIGGDGPARPSCCVHAGPRCLPGLECMVGWPTAPEVGICPPALSMCPPGGLSAPWARAVSWLQLGTSIFHD